MEDRRPSGRNLYLVILVFVVFFAISLLTNIVGPLVPDIIRSFRLNLTLVAVLPFAFFIGLWHSTQYRSMTGWTIRA